MVPHILGIRVALSHASYGPCSVSRSNIHLSPKWPFMSSEKSTARPPMVHANKRDLAKLFLDFASPLIIDMFPSVANLRGHICPACEYSPIEIANGGKGTFSFRSVTDAL